MKRRQVIELGVTGLFCWSQVWGKGMLAAYADEVKLIDVVNTRSAIALQSLIDGNQRFVQHHLLHPHLSSSRLHELSQSQHPFVTILSCADSRVPAELIFDQGLGDLFNVRVAGNTSTDDVLGSLEYAVSVLDTPLLMVLGHERCGAVTAAVKQSPLPGQMDRFVAAIVPAVKTAKSQVDPNREFNEIVDRAVTENIRYQVKQMQRSPLIQSKLDTGALMIVGARYDLDTGVITIVT